MTRLIPGGGGGGGTCPPTAIFPDNLKVRDALAATLVLPDKVKITDKLGTTTLILPDKVKLTDALSIPAGTITFPDKVKVTDQMAMTLTMTPDKLKITDGFGVNKLILPDNLKIRDGFGTHSLVVPDNLKVRDALTLATFSTNGARSGTPDNDFAGDAWGDQANPGVNHGADTGIQCLPAVLGASEKRAWVKFDLTRFSNLTAFVGGTHFFRSVFVNASVAVANVITATISQNGASSPFTESTVTWTAPPTAGTVIRAPTMSIPTGTSTQTLTFTDADVNSMLGNWVLLAFTDPNTTDVLTTINSRENATPWTFQLQLKR
jgi:hypothetical protein